MNHQTLQLKESLISPRHVLFITQQSTNFKRLAYDNISSFPEHSNEKRDKATLNPQKLHNPNHTITETGKQSSMPK